jgi:small GTP-binding protein
MLHLKYVLLGDTNVGKSSLANRFTKQSYIASAHQTLGVDYSVRSIDVHNQQVRIHIWDIAGLLRFRPIARLYFNTATVILLVYDIGNRSSFQAIQDNWLPSIASGEQKLILVGNKADMQRVVSIEEGKCLACTLNIDFYEVSAKSADGVEQLFLTTAGCIVHNIEEANILPSQFGVLGIRKQQIITNSNKRRCC